MRIIRATHLGMCFGVRDAIALALEHADAGPLTILGDLVHNPTVLSGLEAKGIAVTQNVADVETPTVMVTAHGTSERNLARTRALGLTVVEATCPLVRVAHRAVAALARDGYHVVIVGQRDHVEVRGLTGDLDRFDVVLEDEDVLELDEHPRIGVAAQTTQAVEKVRHLVGLIRRRFPRSDVRFLDTVCKPTKERQSAAVEMARQADVVIVVGGQSSNNTRELVKTCARYCARVHHVQTEADVRAEWFDGGHFHAGRRHRPRRGARSPYEAPGRPAQRSPMTDPFNWAAGTRLAEAGTSRSAAISASRSASVKFFETLQGITQSSRPARFFPSRNTLFRSSLL
jgi:4-hydroxy-3-methylbut-2-enyl diphosphate reductase